MIVQVLAHIKAHGDGHGRFNARAADLALSLRAVAVSGGKERAISQDRQPESRTDHQVADIDIAAIEARRNSIQTPAFGRRYADTTRKRLEGQDDVASAEYAIFDIEFPVVNIGEIEVFL